MSKPIPSFTFTSTGLNLSFLNSSTGQVDGYLWDFGFTDAGVEKTSTLLNPLITFPNSGLFTISLSATNSEGSNTFSFPINVQEQPVIGSTISEMVLGEIPGNLSTSPILYMSFIKKWQLYFQKAFKIADADVFNENKWPELVKVLMAKLIIYDLILMAQRNLVTSQLTFRYSGNINPTSSSGQIQLLTDFRISFNQSDPIHINYVLANQIEVPGPTGVINNAGDLITYLNTLNLGVWSLDQNGEVISNANNNTFTKLNFNAIGDAQVYEVLFSQSNQRISSNSNTNATGASGFSFKGPVKKITTGPSDVEWIDLSAFWANLFKTRLLENTRDEICMFAINLGVRLHFCPLIKVNAGFIVGKNCNHGYRKPFNLR